MSTLVSNTNASSPPLPHVPEASAFPGGAVVALHHLHPKGNQLERLADRLGFAAPAEDRLRPLERRRVEEHVLADQRRHRRLRIRMIWKRIRMRASGQRGSRGAARGGPLHVRRSPRYSWRMRRGESYPAMAPLRLG